MDKPKTLGQIAYDADVAARPRYDDGTPRRRWEQLPQVAQWSWERNPIPREIVRPTNSVNE